jgi:hypothetical protein
MAKRDLRVRLKCKNWYKSHPNALALTNYLRKPLVGVDELRLSVGVTKVIKASA